MTATKPPRYSVVITRSDASPHYVFAVYKSQAKAKAVAAELGKHGIVSIVELALRDDVCGRMRTQTPHEIGDQAGVPVSVVKPARSAANWFLDAATFAKDGDRVQARQAALAGIEALDAD